MSASLTAPVPPGSFVMPVPPKSRWDQHEDEARAVVRRLRDIVDTGLDEDGVPSVVNEQTIEIYVTPEFSNQQLREFAIKNKIVNEKQFAAIERRVKIKHELKCTRVPANPTELIYRIVQRDSVVALYNGMLNRTVRPYAMVLGERVYATDDDLKDHMVATQMRFLFPSELNMDAFELELRQLNTNLMLGFGREEIADAVTIWHSQQKLQRKLDLYSSVGTSALWKPEQERAEAMWLELVTGFFDLTEESAEFIIAVLKKFMWQVKRKMLNSAGGAPLPISNHLMPVILGPQGIGKSTFVKALLAPLGEVTSQSNFKAIEDDRNIDLWDHFILFLDEMGYASKANVEEIKHCITADYLARRPMRTNTTITILQNATFIGCSNKELAQLIKDPTGIRRFVGIRFRNEPDWSVLEKLDAALLWASVAVDHADPMIPFIDRLKEKQEADRELGPVEAWLETFDPNARTQSGLQVFAQYAKGGNRINAGDLFSIFKQWEADNYPGKSLLMSSQDFGYEMRRLVKIQPQRVPFVKGPDNNKGATWIYSGDVNVVPMARTGYIR